MWKWFLCGDKLLVEVNKLLGRRSFHLKVRDRILHLGTFCCYPASWCSYSTPLYIFVSWPHVWCTLLSVELQRKKWSLFLYCTMVTWIQVVNVFLSTLNWLVSLIQLLQNYEHFQVVRHLANVIFVIWMSPPGWFFIQAYCRCLQMKATYRNLCKYLQFSNFNRFICIAVTNVKYCRIIYVCVHANRLL